MKFKMKFVLFLVISFAMASCSEKIMEEKDSLNGEISGGSCSLDPRFEYSFEFFEEEAKVRRWEVGFEEDAEISRGSSHKLEKICSGILLTKESFPPFPPSSIPVQIKFFDKETKYFNISPTPDIYRQLLDELKKSFDVGS